MRGFILHTAKAREEDLVVRILTKDKVLTLYRFYGARHSYINTGYLIDFVEEETLVSINRLRSVMQLPFDFLMDFEKMVTYKEFIRLLNNHLIDVERVDSFYFEMLEEIVKKLSFRDAKRVLIESYVKLLKKEGRLHPLNRCYFCEKEIKNKTALARAFLPAHEKCILSGGFEREKLKELFEENKTIFFDNKEIDKLWKIITLGF
ncbi:MAG: recombination protein RecO [Nautiliaceae bacterium]